MAATHTPMAFPARVELFEQLATMESAKLTYEHTIGSLHLPGDGDVRLQALRRMLASGVEFCNAGENSGVFTKFEANILRAATASGNKERMYRRLAEYCAQRATQSGFWKLKLMLPLLALIAAVFIRPVPGLMNGILNLSRYITVVISSAGVLGAGIFLAFAVPQWLRLGSLDYTNLTPARALADHWLLRLPRFGRMHLRHNLRNFFESMGLMLDAGMSLPNALPHAMATVTNSELYKELAAIAPRIKRGESLSKVLLDLPFAQEGELITLVMHGESTNRLAEVLLKHAADESSTLEAFRIQVATWIPWIIYGLIACWLAFGLHFGYRPETAPASAPAPR